MARHDARFSPEFEAQNFFLYRKELLTPVSCPVMEGELFLSAPHFFYAASDDGFAAAARGRAESTALMR